MYYRLLETTRVYALEKLQESGELEQFKRRHAEYYRELFERAEAEWEMRPTAEWLVAYGRKIDNVRAALDWAFSPDGDTAVGIGLTTASVPLWFQLSLMDECRARVERALSSSGFGSNPEPRRDMKLYAALGASLLYTKGPVQWIGLAIGYRGDPMSLPDNVKERDLTPRQRKPMSQFVFAGKWGKPSELVQKK